MSRRKSFRDYQGRTVLITGAAGGLGAALCRAWGKRGASIAALDIAEQPLAELAADLKSAGIRCATAIADLRREDEVRLAIAELSEHLGEIHSVICNAGITHLRNFTADQSGPVRRVMEVNFFGAVHTVAATLDSVARNNGQIIVISSVAGFAPLLGRSGYCASKHALHGFFDTLRLELRHTDVDVMLVCPSFIATGIRSRQPPADNDGDRRARITGREMSPEKAAELIFSAARQRRRFLTVGRVGRLAWWCRRWVPRFYDRMMLRKIRDERP